MAKWDNTKPAGFMAGEVPHGNHEPAFVNMYKGCSIYSYNDTEGALRLVMFGRGGDVKHGTREALHCITRDNLENRYNLELVREIG